MGLVYFHVYSYHLVCQDRIDTVIVAFDEPRKPEHLVLAKCARDLRGMIQGSGSIV